MVAADAVTCDSFAATVAVDDVVVVVKILVLSVELQCTCVSNWYKRYRQILIQLYDDDSVVNVVVNDAAAVVVDVDFDEVMVAADAVTCDSVAATVVVVKILVLSVELQCTFVSNWYKHLVPLKRQYIAFRNW